MKGATKSDWRTTPLPSKRSTISLSRHFSLPEIQLMQSGFVPEDMDDRWFVYWQSDTLFFHRTWSGFCIYVVRFAGEGDSYRMIDADVNRDPKQYRGTNDDHDAKMIEFLINVLLLKQEANFPHEQPNSQ